MLIELRYWPIVIAAGEKCKFMKTKITIQHECNIFHTIRFKTLEISRDNYYIIPCKGSEPEKGA